MPLETASELIEPGIRALCDALNGIPGVRTLYSCEGHWQRNMDPYVLFRSSIEFAAELNHRIYWQSPLFDFHWGVQGRFIPSRDPEGRVMQFLLTVQSYKLSGQTWLDMLTRWVSRNALKRDLELIEFIVRQINNEDAALPPVQITL